MKQESWQKYITVAAADRLLSLEEVNILKKRTDALTVCNSLLTEPTLITSPAGHLDVTVGESIVLPCQVSHDPTLDLKFTWFFNEQLIHFGSHWAYFEKIGGVSAVTLWDHLCHCVFGGNLIFCSVEVEHIWSILLTVWVFSMRTWCHCFSSYTSSWGDAQISYMLRYVLSVVLLANNAAIKKQQLMNSLCSTCYLRLPWPVTTALHLYTDLGSVKNNWLLCTEPLLI